MSETNETIASNVRAEMGRQRITNLELARLTGINRMSLSRRLSGDTALTIDDLSKIAAALKVDLNFLIETAVAS